MTDKTYAYEGSELDLFMKATHWKAYWGDIVRPYLGRHVLDVGAGNGATVRLLCGPGQERWVALEPDAALAEGIRRAQDVREIPSTCDVRVGTLADVSAHEMFDSVVYVDVLEHIEDDRAEVARAAAHLKPDGHLMVLAPAHQYLFSPFDQAIGHFRRYDTESLRDLAPKTLSPVRIGYLDSVGLLASLGNRLLLQSAMPTATQIAVWDRWMVPLSRYLDPITGHRLGKSVLAIWQKL